MSHSGTAPISPWKARASLRKIGMAVASIVDSSLHFSRNHDIMEEMSLFDHAYTGRIAPNGTPSTQGGEA
jgi:hypothetical protein